LAASIKSTAAMRAAFEAKTYDHLIYRDALAYAIANNYSPDTIDKLERAALDRVKASRVRLELQGAPLLYKPASPPTNANDPTPEWQSKAGRRVQKIAAGKGEAREGDVAPRKAFKFRSIIEQYASKLLLDRRTALERFIQDGIHFQSVRTANLEPSGGRGDGSPIGGLGDVDEYARLGATRYAWVYRHLGDEAREVASALVTHETTRGDGAPFSLEEFGKRLCPDVVHVHRLWGAAFGALKVLSGQLMRLYELCPTAFVPVSDHERKTGR
jgi:hypothetical protein